MSSREADEVGKKQHDEQFGDRGKGDVDAYGYPGEDPLPDYQNKNGATLAEINQLLSIT